MAVPGVVLQSADEDVGDSSPDGEADDDDDDDDDYDDEDEDDNDGGVRRDADYGRDRVLSLSPQEHAALQAEAERVKAEKDLLVQVND